MSGVIESSCTAAAAFRKRFCSAEDMLGTFIKTPGPSSIEIIASVGFDFVVIDAEHAPFDRGRTETALLAARASGVPAIVRVPAAISCEFLSALDDGAYGVLAPHVSSTQDARDLVTACRYRKGRGFSNSPRAGGYGARGMWEHVDAADQEVTVIAMIEDPAAIDEVQEIVSVEGIDGIFIGRGDLAVALNDRETGSPLVRAATEKVIQAARRVDKPVCLLVSDSAEADEFRALGASAFVASSDQGFLRKAATDTFRQFSKFLRAGGA